MLRAVAFLFSLFLFALPARAEEYPLSSVIGFVPAANGYYTLLLNKPGTVSSITAPLAWFYPAPGGVWVGDPRGRSPGASQGSGAAYAVSAAVGAPRATTTPPGSSPIGPASEVETTWITADGSRQTVRTPCFSHANPTACAAAHQEMVRAMMALFPPRPG